MSKPLGGANPLDRRCTARSKRTGEPCKRFAIAGGNVCPMHGGAAPQTKAAAQERIQAMVSPALSRIRQLMDGAESDSVKLQACRDVLDRAGLAGAQVLQHQGPAGAPLLDIASVRAYMRMANDDGSMPSEASA